MQRSNNDFAITTKRDGSRTFGEHDDRWVSHGNGSSRGRKVYSAHSYRWRRDNRGRGRVSHSYYHGINSASSVMDREGDTMMGGDADHGAASRRHNPYGSRPPTRHGRRNNYHNNGGGKNNNRPSQGQDWAAARRMGLPVHGSGKAWYQVVVPMGKKVDKQVLLDLIGSFVPRNFRPVQISYSGESMTFFVDDSDVADILKFHSKKHNMPNSTTLRLVLIVKPSSPPSTPMNDENKAKLTVVLSSRYDPSVKVLDLTTLHEDQALKEQGLFLPLNRPIVTNAVATIIEQNIPELVGLNLSKNRLLSLSAFTDMTIKAPNVTSLNLSNNQLSRIEELDKIKGWKLVELILDENPLCKNFTSKSDYISAIRKRFPNIIRLDGNELPPPIRFDVGASVVPASKGSYFVNGEVQDLVVRFLKEYYTIYDSDSRLSLADAYHESALFSLAMSNNPAIESKQPFMSDYISESRNSIRIRGDERSKNRLMDQLLKKGRQQVVASLCSLPKTTHDASSFVVDVSLVSSTLLSFVVTGLFKETDNKVDKPPIRSFTRCFIAVPANGGVLITNDMLTITNATSEQTQVAFKSTGPTPSSSPVLSNPPVLTSPVPSTSAPPEAVALSPQQQLQNLPPEEQQMVLSFSQQSGMNFMFSFRCLEDNAWNYDKAAQIFVSLQAEGKIPAEAFAK